MVEKSLRVQRVVPPVRAQVVENLRQAILEMRFKPGQRLIERELVEATGVSRTSIREALRELSGEGLVMTIPNKGTVVSVMTRHEATQIYELRSSLEALAGRLFVLRASDAQVAALERAFNRIERAVAQGKSMLPAKDAFYDIMFAGTGNDELRQVVAGFHARANMLRALSLSREGRPRESLEEVREIMRAIRDRDPDAAAKACSFHVEQAGRVGLLALDELTDVVTALGGVPATRRTRIES